VVGLNLRTIQKIFDLTAERVIKYSKSDTNKLYEWLLNVAYIERG